MILMQENLLRRPLEGLDPEISTFLAQMALSSLVATKAQKSLEFRNNPLKGPL